MKSADSTPRAVVYSALLHVGIVVFLALATLNCSSWEGFANFLHLPQSLRPVTCTRVVRLEGPVIEATLVGPATAPAPHESRHKASPRHPQEAKPKPRTTRAAPVRVLPTPVPRPKPKDQEKIAQLAQQKAEKAERAQEEQHRQRMAELTKQQEAERILKTLAKVEAEQKAQQKQVKLEQQKAQQLADLRKAEEHQHAAIAPPANKATTGQGGNDTAAYQAALTNVIVKNWYRPFDIPPGTVCPVEIEQVRGGQVVSVRVLPTCPLNAVGKHSVEAAVRRSSPLPYKGFEKEFVPDLILNFTIPTPQ